MGGLQVVVLQASYQGASQLDSCHPWWLAQVVGGCAQPGGGEENQQGLSVATPRVTSPLA